MEGDRTGPTQGDLKIAAAVNEVMLGIVLIQHTQPLKKGFAKILMYVDVYNEDCFHAKTKTQVSHYSLNQLNKNLWK